MTLDRFYRITRNVFFVLAAVSVVAMVYDFHWQWILTALLCVFGAAFADAARSAKEPYLLFGGVSLVAGLDAALWTGHWRWLVVGVAGTCGVILVDIIQEHRAKNAGPAQ